MADVTEDQEQPPEPTTEDQETPPVEGQAAAKTLVRHPLSGHVARLTAAVLPAWLERGYQEYNPSEHGE